MSTAIYARVTKTYPRTFPTTDLDMLIAHPAASGFTLTCDTSGATERQFLSGGVPMKFISERVTAGFTLAGSVTFDLYGSAPAGFTGRFRAKIYKITAGGSDVETFIGQADAASDFTTTPVTQFTFSFTPSPSIAIAANERFLLRIFAIPTAGSFGTGVATFNFNSGVTSRVTFTETFTTRTNGVVFFTRRTGTTGIGAFFDLSETRSAVGGVTAVTNTVASGTEIQCTATAGGSVLEWISPRIKGGWTMDLGSFVAGATGGVSPAGIESNAAANCTFRCKLWKRSPAGVETLIMTGTNTLSELGTGANGKAVIQQSMMSVPAPVNVVEDDRLVLRLYVVPFGALTMGGPFTVNLFYDTSGAGSAGDVFVALYDSPEFKAEGDPAGTSRITDGLSTSGIGN